MSSFGAGSALRRGPEPSRLLVSSLAQVTQVEASADIGSRHGASAGDDAKLVDREVPREVADESSPRFSVEVGEVVLECTGDVPTPAPKLMPNNNGGT